MFAYSGAPVTCAKAELRSKADGLAKVTEIASQRLESHRGVLHHALSTDMMSRRWLDLRSEMAV